VNQSSPPRISLGTIPLREIKRSADSLHVEEHWKSLRGDALLPPRSAVIAQKLPPRLLSGIGLISVQSTNDGIEGIYRLAGTKFRQITGIEITGGPYRKLVDAGDLDERSRIMLLALRLPVGAWWVSEILLGEEYSCYYQSTLLPLRSDSSQQADHFLDLVESDIPIIAHGLSRALSSSLLKYQWIDIGAGTPDRAHFPVAPVRGSNE
jgi:hypothetical protein